MPKQGGLGRRAVCGGQPCTTNITTRDILADIEAKLVKSKRTGDTLMARCPAHDDKTPSLSVTIGDKKDCVILTCFAGCTTEDVVAKLGLTMRELFATDDAWRSPGSLQTYDWTNYLTGETVTQTRHAGANKYRWPKGAEPRTLVYLKRYHRDATRPIVWTEGAKAATAAASKLPDYDVIAFASSSTIPDDATLTVLSQGRSCVIWPDDDLPGVRVATRLCAALRQAGADGVTVVDPARLRLTGGHGHDAAEWKLGKNPKGEFEAACRVEPITNYIGSSSCGTSRRNRTLARSCRVCSTRAIRP